MAKIDLHVNGIFYKNIDINMSPDTLCFYLPVQKCKNYEAKFFVEPYLTSSCWFFAICYDHNIKIENNELVYEEYKQLIPIHNKPKPLTRCELLDFS